MSAPGPIGHFVITAKLQKLFDLPAMGDYDPAPDGQRFFIVKFVVDPAKARAAPPLPSTLTVVLNWAAELKRKLPQ